MSNIFCCQLKKQLIIHFRNTRLLSGLKSELDSQTKRIQRFKRYFAFSLFGITLSTALLVKHYKRKQWFELMQKTKRLQVLMKIKVF